MAESYNTDLIIAVGNYLKELKYFLARNQVKEWCTCIKAPSHLFIFKFYLL